MDATESTPTDAGADGRVAVIELNSSDPAEVEKALQAAPPGATIVIGSPRLPVTADRPYAASGLTAAEVARLLPSLRKIVDVQARERGRAMVGRHAPERPRVGFRPAGSPAGRNEPCWCGSGKKRKKCHPR